jgi:hypothetical protein
MSFGAALLGATKATLATAAGSAWAAANQAAWSGRSFSTLFWRNFDMSGALFVGQVGYAATPWGGGIADLGARGGLSAFVHGNNYQLGKDYSTGLTLGSSTSVWGGNPASVIAHEFGHAVQFIGMIAPTAALGTWAPWISYGALGGWGAAWQGMGRSNSLWLAPGRWFEQAANP